jgi:beta-lactamase regulating signal transducer with metallopeptidase domain
MNALIDFLPQGAWNSGVAAAFLDAALKSFVVLAVAGVAALGLRGASAAARHLIWYLAIVGLLVMPLISPILPSWHRALWSVAINQPSASGMSLVLVLAPTADVGMTGPQDLGEAAAFESSTAIGIEPGQTSGMAADFHPGWLAVAIGVWLTGVVIVLSSMTIGRLALWRLSRSTHALQGAGWAVLLGGLRVTLKIRRPVLLVQSSNRVMPATWGWWRPIILLPAEAGHWSLDRRRMVLLHELAHVKRWDCLTQTIAGIAGALYWFNPLVWLAARRMCVERERACDDLALRGGWKPSEYATHLVDIAQASRVVWLPGAVSMGRSSRLRERIAAIVDSSRHRNLSQSFVMVSCLLTLGLVGVLAAHKPQANEPLAQVDEGLPSGTEAGRRALFAAKAEQYVTLSAEIDYFLISYAADTNSATPGQLRRTNQWSAGLTGIIGTNEWQLDGNFSRNGRETWHFDGTTVCGGFRIVKSATEMFPEAATNTFLQGLFPTEPDASKITIHIYQAAGGYLPGRFSENIAWLAFCSGTYLKIPSRLVPLPVVDSHSTIYSFAYRDETDIFDDELGLPRAIRLFASRDLYESSLRQYYGGVIPQSSSLPNFEDGPQKFQYRVLESTNVLGWHFPVRFEFQEDYPTVRWGKVAIMRGGSGRILSIQPSSRPPGLFNQTQHQTVVDYRFWDERKRVRGMSYEWTNTFLPRTNDPSLIARFASHVRSAPEPKSAPRLPVTAE